MPTAGGIPENYPTAPSSGPHRPGTPTPPIPAGLLFPTLCEPTATLWTGEPPDRRTPAGDRGVMMPKRRHTRAHNTAKAIKPPNADSTTPIVAERNKPPPF